MNIPSAYGSAARDTPQVSEETGQIDKRKGNAMEASEVFSGEGRLPNLEDSPACRSKGKMHVTDGPFAESKEVIGGIAVQKRRTSLRLAQSHQEPITFRRVR